MPESEREDTLLRQIRALAAMLARIITLRTSGQADEARAELERAYRVCAGETVELVRRADPATVVMLLGSVQRARAWSQLLDEEAAQERDPIRSEALRRRGDALRQEIDKAATRRAAPG